MLIAFANDEDHRLHDRTGALAHWNDLLDVVDELDDVGCGWVSATVSYRSRLEAAGAGSFPWNTGTAAKVSWLMRGETTEADLDKIPAVRHLERTAGGFLPHVPVRIESDGRMAGVCEIAIEPGNAAVSIFQKDGPEATLSFRRIDGGWRCALTVDWDIDRPLSDLVDVDLGDVFERALTRPGTWPAKVMIEDDRVYATVNPAMILDMMPL